MVLRLEIQALVVLNEAISNPGTANDLQQPDYCRQLAAAGARGTSLLIDHAQCMSSHCDKSQDGTKAL